MIFSSTAVASADLTHQRCQPWQGACLQDRGQRPQPTGHRRDGEFALSLQTWRGRLAGVGSGWFTKGVIEGTTAGTRADGGWLRKTNTWYYLVLDVVGVMLGRFKGCRVGVRKVDSVDILVLNVKS